MKKKLAFILALALSAGSMTAFADEEIEVKGKYVAGTSAGTIIAVDVTWEDMTFTYTDGDKTWNPDTHEYDTTEGSWGKEVTDAVRSITVTNHSNAQIKALYSFKSDVAGLEHMIYKNVFLLDNAEGTEPENAPQFVNYLGIYGGSIDSDQKLGTLTVTIAEHKAYEVDSEGYTMAATFEELETLLDRGGKIKFANNIEIPNREVCELTKDVDIDLNGHTLKGGLVNDGFDCKIKNGKINTHRTPLDSNGGTTDVKNCELISSESCAVNVSGGTVTLTDCKMVREDRTPAIVVENTGTLILKGNSVVSGKAALWGGTTVIGAGTYDFDPTNYVDENSFTIAKDGENWVVTAK